MCFHVTLETWFYLIPKFGKLKSTFLEQAECDSSKFIWSEFPEIDKNESKTEEFSMIIGSEIRIQT